MLAFASCPAEDSARAERALERGRGISARKRLAAK
jgi:hypothetical protein